MAEREIRTIGTVHLPGQSAGFPPGTVLTVPEALADELLKSGHAEAVDKEKAEPDPKASAPQDQ